MFQQAEAEGPLKGVRDLLERVVAQGGSRGLMSHSDRGAAGETYNKKRKSNHQTTLSLSLSPFLSVDRSLALSVLNLTTFSGWIPAGAAHMENVLYAHTTVSHLVYKCLINGINYIIIIIINIIRYISHSTITGLAILSCAWYCLVILTLCTQ